MSSEAPSEPIDAARSSRRVRTDRTLMAEREALALSPEDREHHDRRADVGDHQEDLKQSAQRDARIVPRPEDVVRVVQDRVVERQPGET